MKKIKLDQVLIYIMNNLFPIKFPLCLCDNISQYLQFKPSQGNMDKHEELLLFLMDYNQIYMHRDVHVHFQWLLDMHMSFFFFTVNA